MASAQTLSNGYTGVMTGPWTVPVPVSFTLVAGAARTVILSNAVNQTAVVDVGGVADIAFSPAIPAALWPPQNSGSAIIISTTSYGYPFPLGEALASISATGNIVLTNPGGAFPLGDTVGLAPCCLMQWPHR